MKIPSRICVKDFKPALDAMSVRDAILAKQDGPVTEGYSAILTFLRTASKAINDNWNITSLESAANVFVLIQMYTKLHELAALGDNKSSNQELNENDQPDRTLGKHHWQMYGFYVDNGTHARRILYTQGMYPTQSEIAAAEQTISNYYSDNVVITITNISYLGYKSFNELTDNSQLNANQ